MSQDIYQYLNNLHQYIQYLEKRIGTLETTVSKLTNDLSHIKGRPPIHVDKLEYHFDQLKVESLDGTLNIGLNPSDLQGIEDFAINNQAVKTPYSPRQVMERSMEIEDVMYQFLENDLSSVIQETKNKLNVNLDESYIQFIKEDVKKQLPNRIDYYLKQNIGRNNESHSSEDNTFIINQIKKEIENGVHTFISNLPDNMKGMNNS